MLSFIFRHEDELLPASMSSQVWLSGGKRYAFEPLLVLFFMFLFNLENTINIFTVFLFVQRCGLRDVPTFVANFLMPFGNITVCC